MVVMMVVCSAVRDTAATFISPMHKTTRVATRACRACLSIIYVGGLISSKLVMHVLCRNVSKAAVILGLYKVIRSTIKVNNSISK